MLSLAVSMVKVWLFICRLPSHASTLQFVMIDRIRTSISNLYTQTTAEVKRNKPLDVVITSRPLLKRSAYLEGDDSPAPSPCATGGLRSSSAEYLASRETVAEVAMAKVLPRRSFRKQL